MSKPKSLLATKLDEAQQAELAEWMLSGTPYHQCQLLVKERFGLEVRSLASFSEFWSSVCQPLLLVRRRRMAQSSEQRADVAESDPVKWEEATLDALKEKAYQLSISPSVEPSDVKAIFVLLQKARDQDLKRQQLALETRKVTLLEARAAQANAAEAALKDSSLTAEQRQQRIRQIFGL